MLDAGKIRVCPVLYMSKEKPEKGHTSFLMEILEATRDSAEAWKPAKDIAAVVPPQLTGHRNVAIELPANINKI